MTEITRTFIQEINELVELGTNCSVEGVGDFNGEPFTVELDLQKRTISSIEGINHREFTNILFRTGLLPSKNEVEIKTAIRKRLESQEKSRVFGIAIDTNILLSRYVPSFFRRNFLDSTTKPIIIVPRAICHELHYKEGMEYKKHRHCYTNIKDFFATQTFDLKNNLSQLLFGNTRLNYFDRNWGRLSMFHGRLGQKGLHELRQLLQSDFPVILSKPEHLYYSPSLQEEASVADAIFDSLIRYEIDFLGKNTNVELLFLTADKDQSSSANLEGIPTIYVEMPTRWHSSMNQQYLTLRNEEITTLLFELMVYSPYISITIGNEPSRFYSAIWHGKTPQDQEDGIVQKFVANQTTEKIKLL
jgi:hypothetical protein